MLADEHSEVVHKFLESYDLPTTEARDLFRETRRFLWLAAQSQGDTLPAGRRVPNLGFDPTTLMLDEMWHTFILFTHEYTSFCQRHFGRYLHHAPVPHAQKRREALRAARDPEGASRARARSLRAQYSYVYDQLGEATVLKWYQEFPSRYTPKFVASIRRSAQGAR